MQREPGSTQCWLPRLQNEPIPCLRPLLKMRGKGSSLHSSPRMRRGEPIASHIFHPTQVAPGAAAALGPLVSLRSSHTRLPHPSQAEMPAMGQGSRWQSTEKCRHDSWAGLSHQNSELHICSFSPSAPTPTPTPVITQSSLPNNPDFIHFKKR